MQTDAQGALHDALTRAFRQLTATFAAHVDGDSQALRRPDYALLGAVERQCSLRPSDLAARDGHDVSTVSRRVSALVDRGLLRREPDPADGRAFRVALTDAGRERLLVERSARAQVVTGLLRDWSDDDITTLTTLLDRLSADAAAARDERDCTSERTSA